MALQVLSPISAAFRTIHPETAAGSPPASRITSEPLPSAMAFRILDSMAAAPASASRHPKLPHLQAGPSSGMCVWPSSPPAYPAPCHSLPPLMCPAPVHAAFQLRGLSRDRVDSRTKIHDRCEHRFIVKPNSQEEAMLLVETKQNPFSSERVV